MQLISLLRWTPLFSVGLGCRFWREDHRPQCFIIHQQAQQWCQFSFLFWIQCYVVHGNPIMQTCCQHEAAHQSFHLHGWGRQPWHTCQQWYVLISIYFSLLFLTSTLPEAFECSAVWMREYMRWLGFCAMMVHPVPIFYPFHWHLIVTGCRWCGTARSLNLKSHGTTVGYLWWRAHVLPPLNFGVSHSFFCFAFLFLPS